MILFSQKILLKSDKNLQLDRGYGYNFYDTNEKSDPDPYKLDMVRNIATYEHRLRWRNFHSFTSKKITQIQWELKTVENLAVLISANKRHKQEIGIKK